MLPVYNIGMNVSLLSLGCPKNLADSEKLLNELERAGLSFTPEPDGTGVMLVNTCGFVEDAKKESIEEILKLANEKSGGRLVVFGCLAKRYGDDLLREIPEIDAVFGVGEERKIVRYLTEEITRDDSPPGRAGLQRNTLFGGTTAPLKVAEGCNRRCSFCVIPSIRGSYKSRLPDEILGEAEALVKDGFRELMLVAQDLTSYGRDLKGYGLSDLLSDLASISGDFWIRPMYLYPSSVDDRLLRTISGEDKVCAYLDVPFQHSEDRILRAMRRTGTRREYLKLIRNIRRAMPEAALRTAMIVGFPIETEEDFSGLLDFVEEAAFEHLGAFVYSKEEGTPSAALKPQVPARTKRARFDELMRVQSEISLEKNRALVGRTMRALVEEVGDESVVARLERQAQEVDGAIYMDIIDEEGIAPGDFVQVEITGADHYDLRGKLA